MFEHLLAEYDNGIEVPPPPTSNIIEDLVDYADALPVRKHKALVIYHGNCADGFSAAWVFHHLQTLAPESYEFEFHKGVYGQEPPEVGGKIVYLVDFSYKKPVIMDMLGQVEKLVFIDHHQSALEDLTSITHSNFFYFIDLKRSGAMLAWDYWQGAFCLLGADKPLLLGHVEDRDLWKFQLPLTREISAAVFAYKYTFENWDLLMSKDRVGLMQLAEGGQALERKHHKDIADLIEISTRIMRIGGTLVPVANVPYTMASDAGASLTMSYYSGAAFCRNLLRHWARACILFALYRRRAGC